MKKVWLVWIMLSACSGSPKPSATTVTTASLTVAGPKWLDTTRTIDSTLHIDTTWTYDTTITIARIPGAVPPLPTPRFTATCSSSRLVCRFDGSNSIVPAGAAAYSWYFGDGTAAGALIVPSKTYKVAGVYTVRFQITDSLHRSATDTSAITVGTVAPQPPAPPAPQPPAPPAPETTVNAALHRPWMVYSYTDFYTAYHPKDTLGFRLLSQRVDRLTNGDLTRWRAANPNIEPYQYRLFQIALITGTDTLGPTGVGTLDAWLTAHGYPIESAFLHIKDSTATKAHRITYFLKMSNGDSASGLNPADPGFRAYQLSILNDLKAKGYAGVFYDVFGRSGMAKFFNTAEGDSLWYRNALTGALVAERAASGERVTINTASYQTAFDSITVMAAGGVHLELTNYPLSYNLTTNWPVGNWWQWIDHLVAGGATRIEFVSNLAWYDKLPGDKITTTIHVDSLGDTTRTVDTAHVALGPGNDVTPMAHEKMAEYASYLMVKDTGNVVSFAPDNYWAQSPATHWLAAWDTAIGKPTAPRKQIASGTDKAGQRYQVWVRPFTRAEIVMRVNAYPTIPTNFNDSTAITVPLPVAGRLLRSDGTTAPTASSVRLLAGEGVVVLTP